MRKFKLAMLASLPVVASSEVMAADEAAAAVTLLTTDGTAAITAIGGALVGLAALAVVFKWIKGAIFS